MSGEVVPLDRVFCRLAAELGAIEAAGRRVESMVGDLLARTDGPAPADLQELDLLVQTARDLGAFTAALSETVPASRIDLAPAEAVLKLERVRATLSGAARPDCDGTKEDVFF